MVRLERYIHPYWGYIFFCYYGHTNIIYNSKYRGYYIKQIIIFKYYQNNCLNNKLTNAQY